MSSSFAPAPARTAGSVVPGRAATIDIIIIAIAT
jgi:hypothetical protein